MHFRKPRSDSEVAIRLYHLGPSVKLQLGKSGVSDTKENNNNNGNILNVPRAQPVLPYALSPSPHCDP